jgi:hypothetical protein
MESGAVITNREWWAVHLGLLRCAVRLTAAAITGNTVALAEIEVDVDGLHERWAELSPDRRAARDRWLRRNEGGDG